jgi:hypothetical protein
MKLKKLTENKFILYLILFLAITNISGYLAMRDYTSVIVFICIAVINTYFTKNMIINLGITLLITNLFFAGNQIKEGMKNKKDNKKNNKNKSKDNKKNNNKNTKNQKQGFRQKHSPAPATESEEDEEIGKRIDYASTLEQAYDNLQNVLGSDGISGLTKETQQLVNQQKSLMETMKNVGPMLNMAKETMKGFDMKEISGVLGKVGGMMNTMKK